jgi:F0F1-type ATP synthase assembly protein I
MRPATLCCVPPESVEPENLLGYDAGRFQASGLSPRGFGSAYQGAVEATLAVVISVLIGVWADTKLDSSPAFFLVGLGVGFGAFIVRLMRLLRQSSEPDSKESESSTADKAKTQRDTPSDDDRRDTDH